MDAGPALAIGFALGVLIRTVFDAVIAEFIDGYFSIDPGEPTPIRVDEPRKD